MDMFDGYKKTGSLDFTGFPDSGAYGARINEPHQKQRKKGGCAASGFNYTQFTLIFDTFGNS
jgi:hypothetical protein